ncbi:peroxidasin-like [Ylistrum balloti]|uniref:peroxidasin-like n=1 Tax=Ylistrum balloti TaxID=509963 RepID=UPI00290598FE|nr:peroxidasin-like [Ylistrum balloti]
MMSINICLLMVAIACVIASVAANSPHEREVELELAERILDILEDEKRMGFDAANLVATGKRSGEMVLEKDYALKQQYYYQGIDKIAGSDATAAIAYTDYTPTHAEEIDNHTTVALVALEYILDQLGVPLDDLLKKNRYSAILSEWRAQFEEYESKTTCTTAEQDAEYRSIDGSCNNLNHFDWGKALTARVRMIPEAFSDRHGLYAPRKAANGDDLPSARYVSNVMARYLPDLANTPLDNVRTVALTGWGQFIDHDLTETPLSAGYAGAAIECCTLPENERRQRPQCVDIEIPANDTAFLPNRTCMECVRSAGILEDFGEPGRRAQINELSAFLDASNVYGSETERAEEIWDHQTGRLIEKLPGYPPEDAEEGACVKNFDLIPYYCPKAGDRRASDIAHLTVFHILFLRVHNDLVTRLSIMNCGWSPEKLYQEARKIVGAILQHVTYNEWLPLLIGEDQMDKHFKDNYKYDETIQASILDAFASAALRMGHSLVTAHMGRMNEKFEIIDILLNREAFLDPYLSFLSIEEVMRWVVSAPGQESDRFVNQDFLDFLFANMGIPLDLVSINIQRGREHGLGGYAAYHEECGLGKIRDWGDLTDHLAPTVDALKLAYPDGSVEDIDLFIGALSEKHTEDAHLGRTFACIFERQFTRLRDGDRFWFENADFPNRSGRKRGMFTSDQVESIKKVKLSGLVCRHYNLETIQENAFKVPDPNDRMPCKDLPGIDLTPWEE